MTTRISPIRFLQILLILGMVAAGVILYPSLPEQIPSHWNFRGEIDGYSTKLMGVALMPAIAAALSLLLPVLRRLDPYRENYDKFERAWEMIQFSMVAFFAYMQAIIFAAAIQPSFAASADRWIMGGIGALFVVLGNYFGKVRHNFFVGIRTPWTLADEGVWNKTHRLASWIWVIAGAAVLLQSLLFPSLSWIVFVIALASATLIPIVYSYVAFRQKR